MAGMIECGICLERYASGVRTPKNTGCGHMYCLQCLKEHKTTTYGSTFSCPACRKPIYRLPEELETNYAILSEASSAPRIDYYCNMCDEEAKSTCRKKGHSLTDLAFHRKQKVERSYRAVREYANVLEKVVPKVLHIGDVANDVKTEVLREQDEAEELLRRLGDAAPAAGGTRAGDADAMRAATECALKQGALERGLQLLELDKGSFHLRLQGEGAAGPWAATVDMGAVAKEQPEVLVAAQLLFYLLDKHGRLQQDNLKTAKPRSPKAANGQGQAQHGQHGQQGQAGGRQQGQGDARANDRASELVEGGVLDLENNGIGDAPPGQKVAEKVALLRSPIRVTHISGLTCNADAVFCTKLITKHSAYLEDLDIKQVLPEHIPLLGSLRVLANLKIRGCVGRLPRLPPQTGCVLRSLYVGLPFVVQLNVWEAYASSVSNVVLRVRLREMVDVHMSIRNVAQRTPNLHNLQLHRIAADNHTDEECALQMAAVRSVLPPHVRVTCNVCKEGRP